MNVLTGWVKVLAESDENGVKHSGAEDMWPSVCMELSSLLQVNTDILHRHLVCELYNQGLDRRAEEVMRTHARTHTHTRARVHTLLHPRHINKSEI